MTQSSEGNEKKTETDELIPLSISQSLYEQQALSLILRPKLVDTVKKYVWDMRQLVIF